MNTQTVWTVLRVVGWIVLVGGVLLVVAEIVLSLFLPSPPVDRAPLVRVAPHPVLGYALVPNQRTFSYQAPVFTDERGLRVPMLETSTSADRVLLFLGGSETFGKGVAAEETFAKLVESELADAAAINAGVPDYNLDQAILWLERYGEALRPDVVVLTFYWNDLFEEPSIDREASSSDERDAPTEWAPRSVLKKTRLLERIAPVYTRSRCAYVARNALKNWIGKRRGYPEYVWREALLENRRTPEIERAWERVDDALAQFRSMANARGFRPLVLALPIENAIETGRADVSFVDDVRRAAMKHEIATVDATPNLARAARRAEAPYIPWDGRPSSVGHQAIADALLSALAGP